MDKGIIDKIKQKRECSSEEKHPQFLLDKIKQKREFSQLPDSIVERFAEKALGDVKETRSLLRKYFGVFLTNRVVKAKGDYDEILKAHISSKKRDYKLFYNSFSDEGHFDSVVDLGAGVNGFSYHYIREVFGDVKYLAIEASGQLVRNMNEFFKKNQFDAEAVWGDILDLGFVDEILKKAKGKKMIFMFQAVDALENLEKDSSKRLVEKIKEQLGDEDLIVLTVSTESLGGKKKFFVSRKWLSDYISENFKVERDFEEFGERIIVFRKK